MGRLSRRPETHERAQAEKVDGARSRGKKEAKGRVKSDAYSQVSFVPYHCSCLLIRFVAVEEVLCRRGGARRNEESSPNEKNQYTSPGDGWKCRLKEEREKIIEKEPRSR